MMSSTMTEAPTALDLEQEFINHLTILEDLHYVIREGVSAKLIYNPGNKAIFQFAVYHFNETGGAPPVKVFQVEFPDRKFEQPEAAIEWVVERLKFRYKSNEVQTTIRELATRAKDPHDAMLYMQERTAEIERNTVSQKSVWTPND